METSRPTFPTPGILPVHGRSGIPRPSECFTSAMELLRTTPAANRVPGPQIIPPPSNTATGVGAMGIQTASASQLKRHAQRVRSMAQRMQRQRMETMSRSHFATSDPTMYPLSSADDIAGHTPVHTVPSTTAWSWVGRLLRMWVLPRSSASHQDAPVWWQEMDADLAWSVTHYLEQHLGVPAASLTDSTGLRTLLQRHLQWLQMTPEWMQLVGLLLVKRWKHRCGGGHDCSMVPVPEVHQTIEGDEANVTVTQSDVDLLPSVSTPTEDHTTHPLPVEPITVDAEDDHNIVPDMTHRARKRHHSENEQTKGTTKTRSIKRGRSTSESRGTVQIKKPKTTSTSSVVNDPLSNPYPLSVSDVTNAPLLEAASD